MITGNEPVVAPVAESDVCSRHSEEHASCTPPSYIPNARG
jgi:hypothetical protein